MTYRERVYTIQTSKWIYNKQCMYLRMRACVRALVCVCVVAWICCISVRADELNSLYEPIIEYRPPACTTTNTLENSERIKDLVVAFIIGELSIYNLLAESESYLTITVYNNYYVYKHT